MLSGGRRRHNRPPSPAARGGIANYVGDGGAGLPKVAGCQEVADKVTVHPGGETV